MPDEKFEQKRDRLCELFHESDDIVEKWQPIVEDYVEGGEGLHPWNSEDKEKDAQGRLINVRTFEGDDNFSADYYDFEDEFVAWSGTVQEVMRKLPPRFRARFEHDTREADRFSSQYDEKYNFIGDVPDLLDLYDDFCKEREALKWAEFWTNDAQRSIKKDEDVAFELTYNEMRGELQLNGYLIKRCQLYGTLDNALRANNPELSPKDILMIVGCKDLLETSGYRDIRKLLGATSGQWSRIKRTIANVNMNVNSRNSITVMKQRLEEFEPIKLQSYGMSKPP